MTFARTFVASPGIKVLREGKYSQMTPRIATSVRSGSCGLPVPVGLPGLSGHLKPYWIAVRMKQGAVANDLGRGGTERDFQPP